MRFPISILDGCGEEAVMVAMVKLHAGWSLNRLAPALFKDKPVVNAVLADDHESAPGWPVLLIENKAYRPSDAAPPCIASEELVWLNDAVIKYDRANPVAERLVNAWFRQHLDQKAG